MNKYDVVKFDGINPNLIYAPNNLHIRMTRGEHRITDELRKAFGRFERVVIDVDGEWHEFSADSLIRLLESYESYSQVPEQVKCENGGERESYGTRWHELFGTPERAARTLVRNPMPKCGKCILRVECGFNYDSCSMYSQDALLEWLEGDAE